MLYVQQDQPHPSQAVPLCSPLFHIFVVFNDINLAYKFEGSTHPKSSSKAYQLITNQLFDADIVKPCIESARHHV